MWLSVSASVAKANTELFIVITPTMHKVGHYPQSSLEHFLYKRAGCSGLRSKASFQVKAIVFLMLEIRKGLGLSRTFRSQKRLVCLLYWGSPGQRQRSNKDGRARIAHDLSGGVTCPFLSNPHSLSTSSLWQSSLGDGAGWH